MKTKHSKTPWLNLKGKTLDKQTVIASQKDGIIGHIKDESNAKHIVKCVNHFDEMRELIEDLYKQDITLYGFDKQAKKLLEKLKNG